MKISPMARKKIKYEKKKMERKERVALRDS
jgi:hypothetical protein